MDNEIWWARCMECGAELQNITQMGLSIMMNKHSEECIPDRDNPAIANLNTHLSPARMAMAAWN